MPAPTTTPPPLQALPAYTTPTQQARALTLTRAIPTHDCPACDLRQRLIEGLTQTLAETRATADRTARRLRIHRTHTRAGTTTG